jgi:putative membrane protein
VSSREGMETPSGGQPGADVRDYLAEVRTFLAWIRTILGVMGFGFVVARIDRFSLWFGTTLIAVGAALSLLAIQRHQRVVEELNHPRVTDRHPSRQGVFLAVFLALAGVTMALYLVVT